MLIGDKWKIESDSLNIILSRGRVVHPKDGKAPYKDWFVVGYYANVSEVLEYLVEVGVKETELKDLEIIVAKIDEVKEMIREAFKTKVEIAP